MRFLTGVVVLDHQSPTIIRLRDRVEPVDRDIAARTAFVARFIVLREGRRSRAHRIIESMRWEKETTAEQLAHRFRAAFQENGDKMGTVDRDIKRALDHANRGVEYFISHYLQRQTLNFAEALKDYHRSNVLLFGEEEEEVPRTGGWKQP
jgi:hypothetical protein